MHVETFQVGKISYPPSLGSSHGPRARCSVLHSCAGTTDALSCCLHGAITADMQLLRMAQRRLI